MTNETNAKNQLYYSLNQKKMEDKINYCNATPNWNGCDYCDMYKSYSHDENGCHCWKQDKPFEQVNRRSRKGCCHCITESKNK